MTGSDTASRTIHQNPVKAGICKRAEDYPQSCYAEYLDTKEGFTDTGRLLAMFSKDAAKQLELFVGFSK